MFAQRLLTAEWFYSKTKDGGFYPFAYIFRSATALRIGNEALKSSDYDLLQKAISEINWALQVDPYSGELRALGMILNLKLNEIDKAKEHYEVFKLVAKRSYLIEVINLDKP